MGRDPLHPITVDRSVIYDVTSRRRAPSSNIASPNDRTACCSAMESMTDIALEPDASPGRRSRFEPRPNAAIAAGAAGVPVLDVVIPVYNEEAKLADSVYRLPPHPRDQFPFPARITIADNASVDDTPRIAASLADELDGVPVASRKGAVAARCARCGRPRCPSSPIWTSTCRPTWRRSPRSSRR